MKGFHLIRGEGDAAKKAELLIYDTIGLDFWTSSGVTAKQVRDSLASLDGVDELAVRINSPGGDVSEGTAIYNALSRWPGRVVVHIDGMAASVATLVAMAGDEIRTAENAMWMVHQPWTGAVGDAPEMRRVADVLDRFWSAMLTTYSRRTGRRSETISNRVERAGGEWWMTAEEAVKEGFSDAVEQPSKEAQVFGLSRFRNVPERLAASAEKDDAPRAPVAPQLIEVAAPRVERVQQEDLEQVRRRRIVDALRLA